MKRACFFLLLTFFLCSIEPYPIQQLSSIEISNLEKFRERKDLANYRDSETVYKIWGSNYKNIPDFLTALKIDFFENISPLKEVIYEQNECRGYTTRRCKSLGVNNFVTEKFYINKGPRRRISQRGLQSEAYNRLFEILLERARETCYFFSDFGPSNIVLEDDQLLLIDLESVEPLRNIFVKKHAMRLRRNNPRDYLAALREIAKERL